MLQKKQAPRARWYRSSVCGLILQAFAACGALLAACDGPGPLIVLPPLPPRPPDDMFDDDAGVPLPDGATPCKRNAECNDGVDCTVDVCLPAGYCSRTLDNTRCSDDFTCNGVETCDPTRGCVSAPAPDCDDQNPCTIDRCDEMAKDCVHDPRDFDRDGEADFHCPGGTDCDDLDSTRSTGAAELCDDGLDNDCDETIDEAACGAITHDKCDDALDISRAGTYDISVVGAVNDYTTSCSQSGALRDIALTFELAAPQDVKFVARGLLGDGAEEVASIAVQTGCGDANSELQCARGFPGDLRARALPAGRYYLIVSTSSAARNIVVTATYSPPTAVPPNRTCANAIDVSRGGHFDGDFVDVGDDLLSPCTIEGQPDVFYSFDLTETRDVEISAVGSEGSALAVNLRRGCEAMAESVRCENGPRVLTRFHELPKGHYLLVLEGPSSREIAFSLDVAVTAPTPAPAGDSCDKPQPIMLGTTQRVAFAGYQDDIATSCQTTGPDAVFSLHLTAPVDLGLTLQSEGASAAISVQSVCGETRTERQCRTSTALQTRVHNLPAGDYFIVIDSAMAPGLTLKIDGLTATPTQAVVGNDDCARAIEIPANGGLFSGDTRALLQDYSGNCGGGALSKDAAFKLTLTKRQRVVARLDANFDGVLMRYGPARAGAAECSDPTPAACSDDTNSGNGGMLDDMLEIGTHYFIIDGYKDFSAGSYLFDVSVSDG